MSNNNNLTNIDKFQSMNFGWIDESNYPDIILNDFLH